MALRSIEMENAIGIVREDVFSKRYFSVEAWKFFTGSSVKDDL